MSKRKIDFMAEFQRLTAEVTRLQGLSRLFDKAVKDEFGFTIKELHKILDDRARALAKKNTEKRPVQPQQPAPKQLNMTAPQEPQQGQLFQTE